MHYRENLNLHFKYSESSSLLTSIEEDICAFTSMHGGTYMTVNIQYSDSAAGFLTLVLYLKDARSPIKPFAMMCSILNSINKSNYIKYVCDVIDIYVDFLIQLLREELFWAGNL